MEIILQYNFNYSGRLIKLKCNLGLSHRTSPDDVTIKPCQEDADIMWSFCLPPLDKAKARSSEIHAGF